MPEIAEVALTSEILKKYLKNKTLFAFDFISGRYTKREPIGFQEFIDALPLKIKDINSRGKFMWFELYNPKDNNEDHWYIWNTFGLTGMWSLTEPKHLRAILSFKNNEIVYFSDTLSFGTFKFSNDENALNKKIEELSPDFLKDEDFNLHKIKKYKIPIVKILMDQKKIGSGIGNYLVAEILYRTKISPHRNGNTLTNIEIKKLEYWIKYIIKLSYIDNHIGYMTNLKEQSKKIKKKDYHPNIVLKEKSFSFLVYQKKEDPYGNKVKRDKIVGSGNKMRTTYWVPDVQK